MSAVPQANPGVDQSPSKFGLAEQLRAAGPVALRVGHYLANCPDLLDEQRCRDLVAIGDHVPPLPWHAVEKVVATALRTDVSEVFSGIDPAAAWANGIVQVHRARLADGTPITIKLVRPGAGDGVAAARRWLERELPGVLAPTVEGGRGVPLALRAELASWLERQLDLTIEANNMVRMRDLSAGSRFEHVPKPFLGLSSASVLVSEDPGGMPVGELLGRPAPAALPVDRARVARVLVMVTVRQALRYRVFQADLHADNVIVLPGDVVSFVDWSSLGVLDSGLAQQELAHLTAVFEEDTESAIDPPLEIAGVSGEVDMLGFRRQLLQRLRGRPADEQASAELSAPSWLLREILRLGWERGLAPPEGSRLLLRAIPSAEATARVLDPEVDAVDVGRRSLRAVRVSAKLVKLGPEQAEATVFDLAQLVRDAPGQLHKIIADLADGSFSLNVRTAEAEQAEGNRNRRTRLITAAIVAIGLAILMTSPRLPHVGGVSLGWPLGIALAGVYGWLAFEWRRLR